MDGSTRQTVKVWNSSMMLMLLLALMLRLALALVVDHRVSQKAGSVCLIAGDADGYWELAQKIVSRQDYSLYAPPRQVLRMPGFPLVLAVSQSLFGESTLAARCLLACIGTAGCGLTYWLGRELCDHSVGLLAGLYTALSPTLSLFSVLILSETAFATSLVLSLIAIVRMTRLTPSGGVVSASIVAGVLIGLATYMRPTWLYVGPVIAATVVWLRRGDRPLKSLCPSLAWMLVGLVVTLAPWVGRNFVVTGHVVPTTLWVGPSLYDGLHPGATGDSDMTFFERDQLMNSMSEYEMDREYRRRAMAFAWEHPGRTLWLAVEKQRRYWSLVPNAAQFRDGASLLIVLLTTLPLFLLAPIGAWVSRHDLAVIVVSAGSVLMFAALHLLFVGSLRYRLPAEYPLAVLAAIGVRQLLLRTGLLTRTAVL